MNAVRAERPPLLARAEAYLALNEHAAVIALLAASTLVRLIYGLAVNSPYSGPDAATYDGAARAFAAHGPFAHPTGIPYFPAGYPLLLAPIYAITGDSVRAAMAVQVILLAFGTYFAWALIRRELGRTTALITLAALAVSPALTAASSELMYETPLLAGLAIGLDLLSRAMHTDRRQSALAAGSGLVLGVTATIEPKVLFAAVIVLVVAAVRTRSALIVAAAVVALAVWPLALAARTQAADGHFTLSANLGPTMILGLSHERVSCPPVKTPDIFRADSVETQCAIDYMTSHPAATLREFGWHTFDFWAPLAYRHSSGGTWFHTLDYERLLPTSIRNSNDFRTFDDIIRDVWEALLVLTVLAGLVVALRNSRLRRGVVFVAAPAAAFLVMSILVRGDARFRLPVAPYYIALQAVLVVAVLKRWREPNPTASRTASDLDITASGSSTPARPE